MEDMEAVYRQHARTVYKFLLSQCRDEGLAEELTQETFCQAVRSVGRYDGSCKMAVWLCQIAKHLWYRYLKKRGNAPLELSEEIAPALPSAEEEAAAGQGRLDLLRRVHGLPPEMREVVHLRAFGGLSFQEIGEVMGRTDTWARVTFYRGKEKLRQGGGQDG